MEAIALTAKEPHNCPNCGSALACSLASAKMVACEYCESTVILDDDGMRNAGKAGVMSEQPSLVQLGEQITLAGQSLFPVGHARFSYRAGWWDEFWCINGAGEGVWVSVDEGDIAVENPLELHERFELSDLKLGKKVKVSGETFRVTETEIATCEAIRGEFPEELAVGDEYRYWHLSGPKGRLLTLEFEDGEFYATEGHWIDPYLLQSEGLSV